MLEGKQKKENKNIGVVGEVFSKSVLKNNFCRTKVWKCKMFLTCFLYFKYAKKENKNIGVVGEVFSKSVLRNNFCRTKVWKCKMFLTCFFIFYVCF